MGKQSEDVKGRPFGHLFRPKYWSQSECDGQVVLTENCWRCTKCLFKTREEPAARHLARLEAATWWLKYVDHNNPKCRDPRTGKPRSLRVACVVLEGPRQGQPAIKKSDAIRFREVTHAQVSAGLVPNGRRVVTIKEVLLAGLSDVISRQIDNLKNEVWCTALLLAYFEHFYGLDMPVVELDNEKWQPYIGLRRAGTPIPGAVRWLDFCKRKAAGVIIDEPDASIADDAEKTFPWEKVQDPTIRSERAVLMRALRIAAESLDNKTGAPKLLRIPKLQKLKKSKPREGWPELWEIELITNHGRTGAMVHGRPIGDPAMKRDIRYLGLFLYWTGYRQSEPTNLEWKDVDWTHETFQLLDSKNGEARDPFPFGDVPALKQIMLAQFEWANEVEERTGVRPRYVFCRESGIKIKNWWKAWDLARKRVGLKHRIRHDFRRSGVRNIFHGSGGEYQSTMQLTGIKSMSIFQRYKGMSRQDELKRAASGMAAHVQEEAAKAANVASIFREKALGPKLQPKGKRSLRPVPMPLRPDQQPQPEAEQKRETGTDDKSE